jgi:hypothetical protein
LVDIVFSLYRWFWGLRSLQRGTRVPVGGNASYGVRTAGATSVFAGVRRTYAATVRPPGMNRQQILALLMVFLMVFSSVAYVASFVF